MVNITKIYNTFLPFVNVGRRALFIEFDSMGIEYDEQHIYELASAFNHVVYYGNLQSNLNFIKELVKKIRKNDIFKHQYFIVKPDTKITGLSYEKSYFVVECSIGNEGVFAKGFDSKSIDYLKNTNVSFMFEPKNIDDMEEILQIIKKFSIRKDDVFLFWSGESDLDFQIKNANLYKLSFLPNLQKTMWHNGDK